MTYLNVLTISNQLILLITFFFIQKDPNPSALNAAARVHSVLKLFSVYFTLHLISIPLLLFYGYAAPKQRRKSL